MDGVVLPVDRGRTDPPPRGFSARETAAGIVIVWASFALLLAPIGTGLGYAVQGWLMDEHWSSPFGMGLMTLLYGGIASAVVAAFVASPLVFALDAILPRRVGIRARAFAQVTLATALGVAVVALLSGGTWSGMLGLLPASVGAAAFGWWQVGVRAERRRSQTSSTSMAVGSAASSGSGRA